MSARFSRGRLRAGFTLIELLVVVSIIAILISLLFPAVQAVRESARKAHCKNNLKQLTNGLIQHEERLGCLPFGGWGPHWLGEPERGTLGNQPGGWAFNVLAFIEMETVRVSGSGLSAQDRNAAIIDRAQLAMASFTCPTRRHVERYRDHNEGYYRTSSGSNLTIPTGARTDYAANSGDQELELLMALPNFSDSSGGGKSKSVLYSGSSSEGGSGGSVLYAGGKPGGSQGDTAQITVDFADDCSSVDVTSTKDLSNVVLQFADGTYQKFDGLSSPTRSFRGDSGKNIVRLWVKSGTNDSGDCPGCGERFTNVLCVTHDMDEDIVDPATLAEGDSGFPWQRSTGLIGQHYGAPFVGIEDGLSNTYIVGEKYIDAENYATGYDPGDSKNLYIGFSNDTHRWTFSPPLLDKPGLPNQHVFGSSHPGTWNVAFADGSVHSISYEITPEIHRYLGNRADGARLPQDKW